MANFVWPCPRFSRISSPWGNRIHPIYKTLKFHDGIDIGASYGTEILAIAAGTVTMSGPNGGYGNYIRIQHSGGLLSFYGHCSKLLVSVGQSVAAGQKIALVGSTGLSTGPHLHLGMWRNGNSVNPSDYVQYGDTAGLVKNTGALTKNSLTARDDTTAAAYAARQAASKSQTVSSVVLKAVSGRSAGQEEALSGLETGAGGLELLIQNDKIYAPALSGRVTLLRPRKGAPSALKFSVVKDDVLNFQEGNPVSLRYQGEKVFFGYVFTKARRDAHTIDVTCYDQLRYFLNRDTLAYQNKTYTELLKMLAEDYGLRCGTLEDTGWKIESRIEECSLLDMLGNASDETVVSTGQLYVLYDDFGQLCLQNIQNMKLPLLIDAETAQSYDYKSSIDKNVYNRVKLAVDNSAAGTREVYVFNSEENQARWGMLQYYEKLDDATTAQMKARAGQLLDTYNQKQRSLKISGVFGDTRVRGGSSLVVQLDLGDLDVRKYMLVEEARHVWEHGAYTMDLTLSGIHNEKTPVEITLPDNAADSGGVTPSEGSWYSADDLRIVATVVYNEAGYGCTDRHMELVAAVVYNRVRSSLFPDTVYDVVVQPNQYSPAYAQENSYYTQRAMASNVWEHCLALAKKALDGQVVCPSNVVYQANFRQGSGVYELGYTSYSVTYFCYA